MKPYGSKKRHRKGKGKRSKPIRRRGAGDRAVRRSDVHGARQEALITMGVDAAGGTSYTDLIDSTPSPASIAAWHRGSSRCRRGMP